MRETVGMLSVQVARWSCGMECRASVDVSGSREVFSSRSEGVGR